MNKLEGLQYDSLVLNTNVHKLVGKFAKLQDGEVEDIDVDEKAMWLVTGLGYLSNETPDKMIEESLKDTIIVSKAALTEFVESKNKIACPNGSKFIFNEVTQELQCGCCDRIAVG